MQPRIARHRRPLDRLRRWLVAAAALFCAAVPVGTLAAPLSIDTIVVKLRAESASGSATTLAPTDRDALVASLRSAFSVVGHTRDGAYLLELAAPLAIDNARAAINRARLLPQVLYVNVEDPGGAPADPAGARAALAKHPPVHRMIVKYRDPSISAGAARNDALPSGDLDRIAGRAGQPVAQQRAMSGGAYVVRLFQSLPVDQAASLARSLESDPAIEYAVPDMRKMPLLVPNDPLYSSQWHYMSPPSEQGGVNLPPAWSITTGSSSIAVAVLDTGSLDQHPDMAGRYIGGFDFISDAQVGNDGDARDANPADPGDWITAAENANGLFKNCGAHNSTFHGTHVAGTIGAASDNLTGVTGINWVSKIVPVRVLGKCGGYTSDIADGIRWAAGLDVPGVPANANPARVLNLSLGGYACDINGLNCQCEAVMQEAIDAAVAAGSVVVVAAGNSNRPASETSPANCNGVITVGATGRLGQRASYSNYGTMVEISAPGGAGSASVLSTVNTGTTSPTAGGYSYGTKQGTSMATPHVAGIASLMLSVNPALTPAQVTSKLLTTARMFPTGAGSDCNTSICGAGIVDAAAAVQESVVVAQPASTSIVVTSSGSPAPSGTSVTFTATVTGTRPSGTIAFKESGVTLGGCGSAALSGAGDVRTATCVANGLAVGVHSIIANFGGDNANLASTSAPFSQVINAVTSTTTLGSSSNPAAAGNAVTFTATVAGTLPTGSVGFADGGTPLAGCSAVALVGSGNSRTAACTTSTLTTGTHSIVATYGGNAGNISSSSTALSQNIIATSPSAASFIGTDLVTQGNWKGTYGSDGYAIFGDSTSYPAYAVVTPTGKTDYVWAAQSSDARAAQRGVATGRIAACWYSATSFSVDINLTDQAGHRVAFYLLDWDGLGRVTRVDVLDAATSQLLATQTVSSYQAGTYLNWILQGHVIVRFTTLGPTNSVISAIFFDPTTPATTYTLSGVVTAGASALSGVNFAVTGALNCAASNATGDYACTVPQGGSGTVTPSLSGYTFTPPSRSYSSVAANQTAQDYAASSIPPVVTTTTLGSSSNPAAAGNAVTFTATVAGTLPTGSVGFADGGTPLAGCSAVALVGSGNSRTAACTTSTLTTGTHSIVATYGGNAGNISSSSTALSQNIIATSPSAASFIGTDLVTQGNWKGTYGSDGYAIFGDSTSYPAYAVVTPTGKTDYVWAAQSSDARAAQRGVATGRIAACWYSATSFSVDINLTDQAGHRVAFYLLDWDGLGRVTRVDVLDAATSQLLATQTVSSYQAGTYLNWILQGHVIVRFTTLGPTNSVISAIFFDPTTPATTYTLSGVVTAGASALSGVNFAVTGALNCAASNATGDYACTVPQGGSGTVTPSLSGYTFTPPSRSYSSVAANQTAQDYAASSIPPVVTTTTLGSSSNPAAAGNAVTFTATVAGTLPTGSVGFADGGTPLAGCSAVALVGSGNSRTAACTTSTLTTGTHSIVATYGGNAGNISSSSTALSQNIIATSPSAASFIGTDLVTQGNWKGTYGSDGYAIFGDSTSYPAYAVVTPTGKTDYVWAAQSSDARAAQRGVATGRIAACWYSATSFSVDINLTDQAGHRVAFYLLDWDGLGRVTRVDVLDAATSQLLATQTVSSYQAGTYLNWILQGHVIVRFTTLGPTNSVISAIFFDPTTP